MSSGKRFRHRLIQSLIVTVMLFTTLPLTAATNVKLSGTMPLFGDVKNHDFQVSPDGQYAVYLADQNTDEVFELYSVFLNGGTPVRLNPLLPMGRSVEYFQISPDSSRVVYRAYQDSDNVYELYSVPIGGPPDDGVKLNGPMSAGGNVGYFEIAPDSSRVVYTADQEIDNQWELYSVPINGPADDGIKLNPVLPAASDVFNFEISSDSRRVVFVSDKESDDIFELFSVPIKGPANDGVKISSPEGIFVQTASFRITPDSKRVVYWRYQGIDYLELYSVPIGGSSDFGIKLNSALSANKNPNSLLLFTPDSDQVIYEAEHPTEGVNEIYIVPFAGPGGSEIKLNDTLVTGGNIVDFEISPDGNRVVYKADQETDGTWEIYSVPLNGPASGIAKLNATLVGGGNVWDFKISPDGNRVVYKADQETDNTFEFYSVPIVGSASDLVKLNKTLVIGGNWNSDFQISPNGKWVIYTVAQETVNRYELYCVAIKGPASNGFKLNGDLVEGGSVGVPFRISPDSGRVIYRADQNTDNLIELWMTSFDDTPDSFTFVDQTGVLLNTVVTSNTITIQGINTETPISITGGEYSINGGVFTSVAGKCNNGDTVAVRLIAPSSFSSIVEATLTIGGVSDTFTVTTMGLINLFLPLVLS